MMGSVNQRQSLPTLALLGQLAMPSWTYLPHPRLNGPLPNSLARKFLIVRSLSSLLDNQNLPASEEREVLAEERLVAEEKVGGEELGVDVDAVVAAAVGLVVGVAM